MRRTEFALVVSGGSGMTLAARFAAMALESKAVDLLHVVVTPAATKVLSHELGPKWGSARGFCDSLPIDPSLRDATRPWKDTDLTAPIASGSRPLTGVVVLPCSAGMAGSLAHGLSRGLAQRVADVALKQRWPLVIGIRETPMSAILLDNLHRLACAGAHVVPPVPAFYLKPDEAHAQSLFIDHYCLRALDLLGIVLDREDLRWTS
jgi:4-hydroxy-3-polyprenylbenzoate decarboxylase